MALFLLAALDFGFPEARPSTPEARAIAYLAHEVPRWSVENKCYSCHNNGDAARALYLAKRLQLSVPAEALEDTSRWLARPADWAHNGGQRPSDDKVLSCIQFAATLADGIEARLIDDRTALARAAQIVAAQQTKDGSWRIGDGKSLGSPVTLGNCLATVLARRVLHTGDAKRHREAIAVADRWLRQAPVKNVLDAAAVLLGLTGADDADAVAQRKRCLALIRKGEAKQGGWGPYVTSAPEPFDTAVVLLALLGARDKREWQSSIRKGRAFLVATQQENGSWKETTRPAGGDSYAQRLSTAGWATQALLATMPTKKPGE